MSYASALLAIVAVVGCDAYHKERLIHPASICLEKASRVCSGPHAVKTKEQRGNTHKRPYKQHVDHKNGKREMGEK